MIFPKWLRVYGDKSFRGDCNSEQTDAMDFISWLAFNYPAYKRLIVHPKGEGKRTHGQADIAKKTGEINTGASDYIIPCAYPFVMELKIKDHTQAHWRKGQKEYLLAAHNAGCFACVALGVEGAKEAFLSWLAEKEALSCTEPTT